MILSLHGGDHMTTTAQRMKKALELRQMKQADLAAKTGIGKSSISTYLSGEYNPKQKNLYKIAKALNVSETWLMGLDVPMECTKHILTAGELQKQVEEIGFQRFIDLISTAGYEITNIDNDIYEILNERYHWHFKISKKELEELDRNIMNYVCYTTDKFMNEKYDAILERKLKKNNSVVPITVKETSNYDVNAAHARTDIDISDDIDTSENDIMDDENF